MRNLTFICGDFTQLKIKQIFNNIYSRFTIHAISEDKEASVIRWASKNTKSGSKFFIEVRGKKNELYKKDKAVEDNGYYYSIPQKYIYPLKKREFENKLYPTPNKIHKYLANVW